MSGKWGGKRTIYQRDGGRSGGKKSHGGNGRWEKEQCHKEQVQSEKFVFFLKQREHGAKVPKS